MIGAEKLDLHEIIGRIKSVIPGYLGYHNKEYIYDSDKVLRHNLATEIEKFKQAIERIRDRLFLDGRLIADNRLEDVIIELEQIERRFREAGFQVLTEKQKENISVDKLELLYDYDIALLDHIEGLNSIIERLEESIGSPERFNEQLNFLGETVKTLGEYCKRRASLIK